VSEAVPVGVSELLAKWGAGDREALCALVPMLYNDLHKVAHLYMRRVGPSHSLQTTALVNEVYLRLEQHHHAHFQNRSHFVAICALLMRQILIGHERTRRAAKRGAGGENLTLNDVSAATKGRPIDLIALDDALNDLARLDPHQCRIVELRFFGGLSIEETAEVMDISPATVKRHWTTARLWLYHEITGDKHL